MIRELWYSKSLSSLRIKAFQAFKAVHFADWSASNTMCGIIHVSMEVMATFTNSWLLQDRISGSCIISEILCNVNFSYCSSATTGMPDGCGGWVWINFVGCTRLPEPWIVWPGTLEQIHLFGHPIQAWTMPELCLSLFSSPEEDFWYLSVQLNPIFKPLYKSNAWKYFLVTENSVPTYKWHHSQWGYRLSSMSLAENWEPRTYRTIYLQM